MRFVTGDECGVLKESLPIPRKEKLDVTGGHVKLLTSIEQMDRSNGVIDMKWFDNDNDPSLSSSSKSFGAVLRDGRVQEFSMLTDGIDTSSAPSSNKPKHSTFKLVRQSPKLYDNNNEVAIGLHRFAQSNNNNNKKVCVCSSKGQVSIFDLETFADYDEDEENSIESSSSSSSRRDRIVQTFHAYGAETSSSPTLQQQQDVLLTAHASHATLLALGGKERETVVLDMNVGTQQAIWKAKNLPPDPQTLLHPLVWPTAACFMNSPNVLAIGTAYHQVRIYDVRLPGTAPALTQQQRRPVAYSPFDESLFSHRITALCPQSSSNNDNMLLVGDSAGFLSAIDIRRLGGGAILRDTAQKAVIGRYVGPSGSIRQIASRGRVVACVGLDRMLRIYDVKSRRPMHAVYLKQRVNCLLMSPDSDDDDNTTNNGTAMDDGDMQTLNDSDVDVEDKIEDYVDSSDNDGEGGDSEDDANPFDDEDTDGKGEDSPSKKRRT